MSAVSVQLRDAIANLLNESQVAEHWNFEVVPRSAPMSATEIEDAGTLVVSVYTGTVKSERIKRTRFEHTYKPVVAIHKKIDDDLEQHDDLCLLAEQIEEVLAEADNLLGLCLVGFSGDDDRPECNVEVLRDMGIFATAIEIEYTSG